MLRAPKTTSEALELFASDGAPIACRLHAPEKRPLGDVVLVHDAFADQSSFTWPGGLADFFREAGYRVMTFDVRGGAWTYDDVVRHDLPAVASALRARKARGPLWIVGHAFGGHVALAARGAGLVPADAIVTIGTTLWRWPVKWIAKRPLVRRFVGAAERRGVFPAGWRSADGRDDYDAGVRAMRVPVYAIASAGDRVRAAPAAVRWFHAACREVTFDVVSRSEDGGPPPSHAELVTTMKARPAYERALAFLRDRA